MEEEIEQEQKKGFFAKIASWFHKAPEENETYKRKMMDKKVERYLDSNFESYIEEYGMVRSMDLLVYEERHDTLSSKLKVLNDFVREADADIGNLMTRVELLKKNIKGYKG